MSKKGSSFELRNFQLCQIPLWKFVNVVHAGKVPLGIPGRKGMFQRLHRTSLGHLAFLREPKWRKHGCATQHVPVWNGPAIKPGFQNGLPFKEQVNQKNQLIERNSRISGVINSTALRILGSSNGRVWTCFSQECMGSQYSHFWRGQDS